MGLWGRLGVGLLILATVAESVALLRVGHTLWERADEPVLPVNGRLSYWVGALALSAGILWMGLWPAVFSRAFSTTQGAYAGDHQPSVVSTSTDAFARRTPRVPQGHGHETEVR
jgi:formate hydrogenlyase subunit 3/multisubunit Na+/H+ antiporter MnhD subunit